MFKKFKTSLFYRITFILVTLVIFIIMLCTIIFTQSTIDSAYETYYTSSLSILGGINSQFEDYVKQLDLYSQFIFYPDILVHGKESNNSGKIESMSYILNQSDNIESLLYYSSNEKLLLHINRMGSNKYRNLKGISNQAWYLAIVYSQDNFVIEPLHDYVNFDPKIETENGGYVFSFVKKVKDKKGNISVLGINCYEHFMHQICDDALTNQEEVLQCLNNLGEIIYTTTPDFSLYDREYIYNKISNSGEYKGTFEFKNAKKKGYSTVVFLKSKKGNYISYKCIPNVELNKYVTRGIFMMFCIMLGIMAILIPFGIYISRRLTKPLIEVKNGLDKYSHGERDVQICINSKDEIGNIAKSFNTMAAKTNELIRETYELQLANKEAQLYSLIAQINPHFINNVLQTIGGVAIEKGVPEIYRATSMLAQMLRFTIKEDDNVNLSIEINNVQNYLSIQKFRYEDKISYYIQCDEKLNDFIIPKCSIQPLVENAVVHGIEPKKTSGVINIKIGLKDDNVIISIKDNGIGMNQETLLQIRKKIQRKTFEIERKSIGIYNVYQRMKLMYDNHFDMKIYSEESVGTEIVLSIGGRLKDE